MSRVIPSKLKQGPPDPKESAHSATLYGLQSLFVYIICL